MRRLFFPLAFVVCLVITILVYIPGLHGPFVFDDTANILRNPAMALPDLSMQSLQHAMFSRSGELLQRQISMVSFALNYYLAGFDPFYFKLTNLAIHLCNGAGIFLLSRLLLTAYRRHLQPALTPVRIQWISLAIAAAWLLHPLNLTSVLYVVQRMTSLSALFAIWGLVFFVWGRLQLDQGRKGVAWILAALFICMPLSILCKENGILLPLYCLIIEAGLFRFQAESAQGRRFIRAFFLLTCALPALLLIAYTVMHPQWVPSLYVSRDFNLTERLMTEARVMWFYMRLVILPSIVQMGLFHDDIAISRSLLEPVTTLPAILGLGGLLLGAFVARKKAPLVTIGILFFLGGHALESTLLPLEIAHEHRNYLPMYGLLLPLFFHILQPAFHAESLRLRQGALVLFIGLFAFSTFVRAEKWANPFDLAQSEVDHHPNSARSNGEIGSIFANIQTRDPEAMHINYLNARFYYERTVAVDPHYVNGLFGLIIVSSARGYAVEPGWIAELRKRLQYSPFAVNTGDQLVKLMDCQAKEKCKLAPSEIESLLDAAAQNATLTGSTRAKVLTAKISYLINIQKDYPAAVTAMRQTIQAEPGEPAHRLSMIRFLLLLERRAEAAQELEGLRRIAGIGSQSEIEALANELQNGPGN